MSDNTSALDINKVFTFYTPTSWTKEDHPTHNLYPGYIIKKFANYTNADINGWGDGYNDILKFIEPTNSYAICAYIFTIGNVFFK